jgi:hypothetical protein
VKRAQKGLVPMSPTQKHLNGRAVWYTSNHAKDYDAWVSGCENPRRGLTQNRIDSLFFSRRLDVSWPPRCGSVATHKIVDGCRKFMRRFRQAGHYPTDPTVPTNLLSAAPLAGLFLCPLLLVKALRRRQPLRQPQAAQVE